MEQSSQLTQLGLVTPETLAHLARKLHSEGCDLTPLHKASQDIQKERKALCIEDAAKAAADAAKQGEGHRRFVVAIKDDDEVKVAHGIQYKDGKVNIDRGAVSGIRGDDTSIEHVKARLTIGGYQHHIEYVE